jgi:hypothetical protein
MEGQKVARVPEFNPDKLSNNEIHLVEHLGGVPINRVMDDDTPKGLPFAALFLVYKRRYGYPMMSWPEARQYSMEEIADFLVGVRLEDNDDKAATQPDDMPPIPDEDQADPPSEESALTAADPTQGGPGRQTTEPS